MYTVSMCHQSWADYSIYVLFLKMLHVEVQYFIIVRIQTIWT